MVSIELCKEKSDFQKALKVVKSYTKWLNVDLSFQNIQSELSNFQTIYSYPDGAFLLAFFNQELAGGVGFKRFNQKICEIKRLYIYDRFRGKGIAKAALLEALTLAKRYGYKFARLDTLDSMKGAIALYKSFGFREIAPYYKNPLPNTKYFELKL